MIEYVLTDEESEFRKAKIKLELLENQFLRLCEKLVNRRAKSGKWVLALQILTEAIARTEKELEHP